MSTPQSFRATLRRWKQALSPTCREAVALQSQALDRKLTLVERFGLRCHVLLCQWCRRYEKQIAFLRGAFRHAAEPENDELSEKRSLRPEVRERIKAGLRKR